jgi:hypothetical protein
MVVLRGFQFGAKLFEGSALHSASTLAVLFRLRALT